MAANHLVVRDFGPLGLEGIYDPGLSFQSLVEDVRDGQYENIHHILALDPEEGTCRDVTDDVAEALLAFPADDLSQAAHDLLERCGKHVDDEDEEGSIPFDPSREHSTLNGCQQGIRTTFARARG